MGELAIIDRQITDAREKALAAVIGDKAQYQQAAQMSLSLRALEKEIKQTFGPIIGKSYLAWKEALAAQKKYIEPLLEAQRILDSKITDWLRVDEDARLKEDAAREKEAKKQREEIILAQAEHLAENGSIEAAQAILETPLSISVPKSDPPKTEGFSIVERWVFEIIDPGLLPREYLMPDETKIRKVVGALKEHTAIPGVRVTKIDGVVKRVKINEKN